VENYDGSDIVLGEGRVLTVAEFPELLRYKGQTLITTDGTTLLGADDKAGVAEIMCAAEYIMNHPEFRHGPVKIAFTPDEEIGRGVVAFDVARFGADFAYTMDGGMIGELEYENFNAASAKIHIQGRNIHPGYAKNKMINSMLVAMELNAMLPVEQRPEYTAGYEGFIHLISFKGTVEESDIAYIIRDHNAQLFERKKEMVQQCVDFINQKYGNVATAEIKNQYRNMREKVEPHIEVVEVAVKALEMAGVQPKVQPIRGGTDGANLSFMGLPCPNIFAGGHNFHGRLEFVPVESMEKATQVILNILQIFSKKSE
jgi:tripeptide aminopeptidase